MDSSVKYQKFAVTQEDGGTKKSAKSSSVCLTAVLVVLSLLAIAVVCTAIGIGVGVSLTRSKSDQPSPSGLSSDTTVTQEQLQGEYYGTEGGIRFTSTVNATYAVLSITTTSGEYVVYIVHPLASNMTMMGVNNTDFLLMERDQQDHIDYNDYVIPRDAKSLMESIMSGNGKMTDDVLQMLDNKTVNETRQSVLYNLAMSYEATLIIEAAQSLGDRKIMGIDYPSVMSFYQFALRLASTRDISGAKVSKAKDSFASDSRGYQHRQKRAVLCNNGATCSSNRCPFEKYDNDCFGMCGPSCTCWDFVCGDCCVYQYCLTHDQCCHDAGFFSLTCFSVAVRKPFASCTDTFTC
jgi:hypothetical protein